MEKDQELVGVLPERLDEERIPLKNKQGCLNCDHHDCMVCLLIFNLDCETECPCISCDKK